MVAAAVLLGGTASAQTWAVGARGGVSLVKLSSAGAVDTEFLPKPLVGVFGEVAFLGDVLTLRLGAEYAGKGGRVTSTEAGSPSVEYSLGYVQVPVNLRYALGAGAAEAYVMGGATVGFLLSARQQIEDGADTDVKSELSAVDVSLDLGAGIGYRVFPHVVGSLEVGYSLGLNEVAGTSAALAVKSWKLTSVQILVGLTYSFGRGDSDEPARLRTPALASR